MKSKLTRFISALVLVAALGAAMATDLTYTSLPQKEDQEIVIQHKAAVAQAQLSYGGSYSLLSATGTTAVSTNAVTLDRIVINTAGSADSVLLVKTGGTNVASISTASARDANYGIRLSGGLTTVVTGGTAANVTVTYH